jgi:hypothetical protein
MALNRHTPEECEPMDAGIVKIGPHLKGKEFYCTCPFGEHAFYMILDGESSDQGIGGLPAEWRPGTRAIPLEVFRLPE